jgi:hypothetical protein
VNEYVREREWEGRWTREGAEADDSWREGARREEKRREEGRDDKVGGKKEKLRILDCQQRDHTVTKRTKEWAMVRIYMRKGEQLKTV